LVGGWKRFVAESLGMVNSPRYADSFSSFGGLRRAFEPGFGG
jgi:hypothetical protein